VPLAVRSGGHGAGGFAVVDGGIVIDVRGLRAIEIDVAGRSAWAGAGCTAAELTTATVEHGLATGFGDTGSVGISGITLGGGVGYLSRMHGLTIDSLLACELVTAAGEVLEVDADHHPDLFWAVRGGGGNFGVVTRMRYRLADVSSFTGGMLLLPATPATVTGFIRLAEAAPDGLSTILNVMPCPPMPFLSDEHHGSLVLLAMLAWTGPADQGVQVLAPFRGLAEPLADMVAEQPYTGMYPPEEDGYRPMAVQRALFLATMSIPTWQRSSSIGSPTRTHRCALSNCGSWAARSHASRGTPPPMPTGRAGSWPWSCPSTDRTIWHCASSGSHHWLTRSGRETTASTSTS
jgi:hypothetical protein